MSHRRRAGRRLANHRPRNPRPDGVEREGQSRFTKPVNLKAIINLIDEVEWTTLGVDVKAAAYEDLLEKAASEGKKGAGQYFTPRKLMDAICACIRPDPRQAKEFIRSLFQAATTPTPSLTPCSSRSPAK